MLNVDQIYHEENFINFFLLFSLLTSWQEFVVKSGLTSLLALESAPWCNSSVTASMWPPAAAKIKGVVPSWKKMTSFTKLNACYEDSIGHENFPLTVNVTGECMPATYFLINSREPSRHKLSAPSLLARN